MLQATHSTAEWTSKKIIAICDLMDQIRQQLRQALPKIYSYELVDLIFTQPYCRIANIVDEGIPQRQTPSKILQALVAQNVLREVQLGREKIFINVELMRLLAREDDSPS